MKHTRPGKKPGTNHKSTKGPESAQANGVVEAYLGSRAALKRFLSRFMVPAHDIDDITQEAFLLAYKAEKRKKIEFPQAFLFRIARNLVLSELGRKSRKITDYIEDFEHEEPALASTDLEFDVQAQQRLGIFCEAIATLPPQCRQAVLLRKVYGMSHGEIAQRMEIAVSTVEKHLVKGVRRCNSYMEDRYSDSNLERCEPLGSESSGSVRSRGN